MPADKTATRACPGRHGTEWSWGRVRPGEARPRHAFYQPDVSVGRHPARCVPYRRPRLDRDHHRAHRYWRSTSPPATPLSAELPAAPGRVSWSDSAIVGVVEQQAGQSRHRARTNPQHVRGNLHHNQVQDLLERWCPIVVNSTPSSSL